MEKSLLEQLETYSKSDYYPFHMPGHKRRRQLQSIPSNIDITEIEGFDNLHHAETVLLDAQKRAARLYGAEESFFLVNGSTAGILAAVSAAVSEGGKLLLARNSHKSVYHGVFLKNLMVDYIYPELMERYGLCGGISPALIEQKLREHPDIEAVFLTSPTYEGMVSNLVEIADITHRNDCSLIVDEAHGAHLGPGGEAFPTSAVDTGADLVIQSLHKTLPSLTQTAVLHVQGKRIERRKLKRYLEIYQTSSPSYVLMASMDDCLRFLEQEGREYFNQFRKHLQWFYNAVSNLQRLFVLQPEDVRGSAQVQAMDPSKICIFTDGREMTGPQLYRILLENYHLQMEMTAGNYVLGMTSMMDTQEGFQRLYQALQEIDSTLIKNADNRSIVEQNQYKVDINLYSKLNAQTVMSAAQVQRMKEKPICLKDSVGRISMEYRYIYPPGIPVLVPGERITPEVFSYLCYADQIGLNIQGQELDNDRIVVVSEKDWKGE